MNTMLRFGFRAFVLASAFTIASQASAQHSPDDGHDHGANPHGTRTSIEGPREEWDSKTIELFATLPVQDGGRVKPLSTVAGMMLLKLNGKRKLETPDGEKIKPTEWLLDAIFYPAHARRYECFLVRNVQVMTAIGLEGRKKSDRYSYDQILPGRQELFQQAQRISMEEEGEKDGGMEGRKRG